MYHRTPDIYTEHEFYGCFSDITGSISKLQLCTARLARKTHNFKLAESLLIQEAHWSLGSQTENGKVVSTESVLGVLSNLRTANGMIDQLKLLQMEREGAKLLHARGQHREAADMLSSSIAAHANMLSANGAVQNKVCELIDYHH